MSDVALINMEYRTDDYGAVHLVPIQDLMHHHLHGCTCGCFEMKIKAPKFDEETDEFVFDSDMMSDVDEDFGLLEEDLTGDETVTVHVAKDGRYHIAEVLTFDFAYAIQSRRKYVKHIDKLAKELKWSPAKKRTYLTSMDVAFVRRWNTN